MKFRLYLQLQYIMERLKILDGTIEEQFYVFRDGIR